MSWSAVAKQRKALSEWKHLQPGSLERELVDSVRAYWRLKSGQALLQAVSLLHLPEIFESGSDEKTPFPVAIHLGGWVDPEHRRWVSSAGLKRANPDVVCRVRARRKRQDVRDAFGRRYGRSGFFAEAYFRQTPAQFFDLPKDRPSPLRGSTLDARRFIVDVLGLDAPEEGTGITIDKIHMYDMSIDDPLGRLAMLAPEELTITMNAAGETALALTLSKRFRHIPSLSEWCDRWAFIGGSDDDFTHPDRRALHIDRPARGDWNRAAEPEVAFPILQPGPGRLVRARTGAAPVLDYPRDTVSIDDCWIQNGGTVYTDSDLILLDRMADPRHERGDEVYIDVYGAASRGDSALLCQHPDSGTSYDQAVFIGGRHDFNWYHWIIEYLPRLMDIDGELDPDVPVLVSAQVPDNGILALRTLTSRTVHTLPRYGRARVRRLHFSAPAMGVPDNYLARWQRILHADTDCLLRFREAVLGAVPDPPRPGPERIFLKRLSKHRSLSNQYELQGLAESMGFVSVSLEKLDFAQQVALFRSAKQVVGCSGAAMANYLFSGPETSVIDLISRHNVDSPLPALICAVSGSRFAYLYGDPQLGLGECRSLHQARHSAFAVRPSDLERVLRD